MNFLVYFFQLLFLIVCVCKHFLCIYNRIPFYRKGSILPFLFNILWWFSM